MVHLNAAGIMAFGAAGVARLYSSMLLYIAKNVCDIMAKARRGDWLAAA